MQPPTRAIPSLQPQVFQYSLDWRFLLPVGEPGGMCLLAREDPQFEQTLAQVGVHASQRLSLSELQEGKHSFHSVVMPFGLPVTWAGGKSQDHSEFYSRLRRAMNPGSHLLIGFENSWMLRPASRPEYRASRPGRLLDQLKQAGFKQFRLFGAMPNLHIPEYIFELEPRAIQFALANRFRRKPAMLRALRLLAGTVGWMQMSTFLPCYFVRAVA